MQICRHIALKSVTLLCFIIIIILFLQNVPEKQEPAIAESLIAPLETEVSAETVQFKGHIPDAGRAVHVVKWAHCLPR